MPNRFLWGYLYVCSKVAPLGSVEHFTHLCSAGVDLCAFDVDIAELGLHAYIEDVDVMVQGGSVQALAEL